jgi:DNA repair exonuclease SbcCD ATPase subunit
MDSSKDKGLSRHINTLNELEAQREKLLLDKEDLEKSINSFDSEINKYKNEIDQLYFTNQRIQESINKHTNKINNLSSQKKDLLNEVSKDILYVHNISQSLWSKNKELINVLVQMKLPKSVSEQFFIDLIDRGERCICGKMLDHKDKKFIRENYNKYLDENNISVLNEVKSYARPIEYNAGLQTNLIMLSQIEDEIEREIKRLDKSKNKIDEDKRKRKEELDNIISKLQKEKNNKEKELEMIITENNTDLPTSKNLKKVNTEINKLKNIINEVERNLLINHNADILSNIIDETKEALLNSIKKSVLLETNNKITQIIKNDDIEVESIDKYIKIHNRAGVSMGQSLSVAYSFVSALFGLSFYNLPFVIDSPAGSLDNNYRSEIANIIPQVFEQLIMFVISSEKPHFTDVIQALYGEEIAYYTIYRDNKDFYISTDQSVFSRFQEEGESAYVQNVR